MAYVKALIAGLLLLLAVSSHLYGSEPPVWELDGKANLELGRLSMGSMFALATRVSDSDSPKTDLRFVLVPRDGFPIPKGIDVKENGLLTLNPDKAGDYRFILAVSDTETDPEKIRANGIPILAKVTVFQKDDPEPPPPPPPGQNRPPSFEQQMYFIVLRTFDSQTYNLNHYAKDSDAGDSLTFSFEPALKGISISDGFLKIDPSKLEQASVQIAVKATDRKGLTASTVFDISRPEIPPPAEDPLWDFGSLLQHSKLGNTWEFNLRGHVKVPSQLKFSLEGPGWLFVNANGYLTGKPPSVGDHFFKVIATNEKGNSAHAQLVVRVRPTGLAEKRVRFDLPIKWQRSKFLWITQNSDPYRREVKEFKDLLEPFLELLAQRGISNQSALLSSYVFNGLPLVGEQNLTRVLRETEEDYLGSLRDRVDGSFGKGETSPLWSLNKFVERYDSEVTEEMQSFFEMAMPVEVIVYTNELDFINAHKKGTKKESWKPSDFHNYFSRFFGKTQQPYTFSVINNVCPPFKQGDPWPSYLFFAAYSAGQYLMPGEVCTHRTEINLKYLSDYITLRTQLFNKRYFPLHYPPLDRGQIKVKLYSPENKRTLDLPGDQGLPTDVWTYNPEANVVVFHWHQVNWYELKWNMKASDEILIWY